MFIQIRETSGKAIYLVNISFSVTIGIAVCKIVALMVVSKCELYHFSIMK